MTTPNDVRQRKLDTSKSSSNEKQVDLKREDAASVSTMDILRIIGGLILLNAFGSILEIITLYAKRPIVEKHKRYALIHPSAEALSSIITNLPQKVLMVILMNTTLYFMANLRRDAGAFFFFLLISFTLLMA